MLKESKQVDRRWRKSYKQGICRFVHQALTATLRNMELAENPAFISSKDFDQVCRSLIERSKNVELLDMRLDLRGEV